MLKPFEFAYLLSEPFLPFIYRKVRRQAFAAIESCPRQPAILDVGGRKSHYTIGLPAQVTISDLPRASEVQQMLNLGVTDQINSQTRSRRSNITGIVYDDMTQTRLPDESYDIVLAIEVLEHVEQDAAFVRNVSRVLRPGGWFIMTTPNGDHRVNNNPDHKRHYRRQQLQDLLQSVFPETQVQYAILGGRLRSWGLKSWSAKHPIQTVLSMYGNVISGVQSSAKEVAQKPNGTFHLFATARKAQAAAMAA